MPQTREHFDIVRLLGLSAGVVAVTKIDRVRPSSSRSPASDVRELVRGSFLEDAPILPVSARTGEGLEALQAALVGAGARGRRRGAARPCRAAADRPGLPDRGLRAGRDGKPRLGHHLEGPAARASARSAGPCGCAGWKCTAARSRGGAGGRAREREPGRRRAVGSAPGTGARDAGRAAGLARGCIARLELLPGAPRVKSGDRLSLPPLRLRDARVACACSRASEIARASPPASSSARRTRSRRSGRPLRRAPVSRRSQTIGGGIVLDPLPVAASRPARPSAAASARPRSKGPLDERLLLWIEEGREHGAVEEHLARRAGVSRGDPSGRRCRASGRAAGCTPCGGRRTARSPRRRSRVLRPARRAELAALVGRKRRGVGVSRGTLLQRLLPGADARWAEAVEAALVARGVFVDRRGRGASPGRERSAGAGARAVREDRRSFSARGASSRRRPREVAEAVRHRPKVVEGLIGYLVKKGTLVRLPGGWIVAQDAVDERRRAPARLRPALPRRRRVQGDVRPDPPARDPAARAPRRDANVTRRVGRSPGDRRVSRDGRRRRVRRGASAPTICLISAV